jgi:hypothetical protein
MEAQSELLSREIAEARGRQADAETYWRGRASDLRSEIAGVEAEISFVNTRLNELPTAPPIASYTVMNNGYPFGRGARLGRRGQYPYGFGRRDAYSGFTQNLMGFRGTSVAGYPVYDQSYYPSGNYNSSFGYPYGQYDNSYERETLTVRLNELLGQRASLFARWRQLEEEARRAGAMPGWLRP